MADLNKPANDDVPQADRPTLAKPFPLVAGIAPQENDGPLVTYTTLSGCSPS